MLSDVEVAERAVDVGGAMEITFQSGNNNGKVFGRSLIFIERNTSRAKHKTRVVKNKRPGKSRSMLELQAAGIYFAKATDLESSSDSEREDV